MATRSSILAWRIAWTEEPGRLQSRGLTESDRTGATYHAGELLSAQRAKHIQAVVDCEERGGGQKEKMEVTIFRALQGQSASAFLPDARRQLNQGPSITFTSSPSSSNSDA